MKSITDFDVNNKRVLVRCDFNVPVDGHGEILDDFKIKKTLPTLQYLMKQKAKIILMSHLGEPNGQVIPTLTLDRVKEKIEQLLGIAIVKSEDCIGERIAKQSLSLAPGQILLLENLRFHNEETGNNPEFAKELSKNGDIYINDAFADCHRDHASIVAITNYLPSGAGLLLQNEIDNLNKILENPKKPLAAIIGGAKVQTKYKFIDSICATADVVLINGLIKKEIQDTHITFACPEKIISPVDSEDTFDIGPETIKIFTEKILPAKTVVWNGPFGKFENPQFKKGTLAIAKAIIKSGAFCVVGGGETIEFLDKEGMIDEFSHVSTGGGAMLAYLGGEKLPGLKVLEI